MADNYYNEPTVAAAMAKARQGDGEELFWIAAQVNHGSRLQLSSQQLSVVHGYLTDPNYLVQWLGVEVIKVAKDKSSLRPLQEYVLSAQPQELDPKTLSKYELIAASQAQRSALSALGEIGADDAATTKLLTLMLAKDLPLEWGGGYAHAAIAKKGREGLVILLQEAETLALTKKSVSGNDHQERFLSSAISSMNDPALLPDFYAACRKAIYPPGVRMAMVMRIARLGKGSPAAEEMLISLANDPALDIRGTAIAQLGGLGGEKAVKTLNALRASVQDDKVLAAIASALMQCDGGKTLQAQAKLLMDEKTGYNERIKIFERIIQSDSQLLNNHLELLADCLNLMYRGEPMNNERSRAWEKLYFITGKLYEVEFDYKTDSQYERYTFGIRSSMANKRRDANRKNHNLSTEEVKNKIEAEIRSHVKKYQTEKDKRFAVILKNDIPVEWGGGLVCAAAGQPGRDGLHLLLKEWTAAEGRQRDQIRSVIGKLRDPALLSDLQAACVNDAYPVEARECLVMTLAGMSKTSAVAENMLIDLARNPDRDISRMAIYQMGQLGTPKCVAALKERLAQEKDERVIICLKFLLLKCDPQNNMQEYIDKICNTATSDTQKVAGINYLVSLDNQVLLKQVDELERCLAVSSSSNEMPLNNARLLIWKKLNSITGKIYPIELSYNDEKEIERGIFSVVSKVAAISYRDNNKLRSYSNQERYAMAKAEVLKHVSRYQPPVKR
ncbi:MAG: HEAT repeat domain-containing protein [bacterium]